MCGGSFGRPSAVRVMGQLPSEELQTSSDASAFGASFVPWSAWVNSVGGAELFPPWLFAT